MAADHMSIALAQNGTANTHKCFGKQPVNYLTNMVQTWCRQPGLEITGLNSGNSNKPSRNGTRCCVICFILYTSVFLFHTSVNSQGLFPATVGGKHPRQRGGPHKQARKPCSVSFALLSPYLRNYWLAEYLLTQLSLVVSTCHLTWPGWSSYAHTANTAQARHREAAY